MNLTMTATDKYDIRARESNSLVCVGLDSDISRLPEPFKSADNPQLAFNQYIIKQTHPYTAAYKLNSAFYEAAGVQGWVAMAQTVRYLHENHPTILVICDAKRGDLGNTSEAYAQSILDNMDFDAVTLNPYQGKDALEPFLSRPEKGCIILCRTSNPGADEFQELMVEGKPLWQHVAATISQNWNENENCMLVIGATVPEVLGDLRKIVGDMTLLIPGVGAQGGDVPETLRHGLNSEGLGLIISASRSIIFSDDPGQAAHDLQELINQYR
ncbi:orotidine-5'-phosphate decarboxylase [Phototrophicus methaneseepsis]|uniref:Orotidine-5'-phosphate decarboxylase n=2 Tax=Phototrophicus methaneseepsis TaxID=2710758 RepID=A0A7S8E6T3_9CHLR|nr:orotidine-5'-phosphate decarboxylase [Phototrophicus methaneseepsis]